MPRFVSQYFIHAVAIILSAHLHFGLLCAQAPSAEELDTGNKNVPVFSFKSSAIEEWLLVGPVEYEKRPEDPVAFFPDVQEGGDVEFSDGSRRSWTRWQALEFAYIPLAKFCRSQDAKGGNMVVYAFCHVVSNKSEERTFYVGADDACRLWVDGELVHEIDNGFYAVNDQSFTLDLKAGQPRSILVEARNRGGDFGFGIASGQTWNGTTTYANGKTPSPNTLLQLREVETGRIVESHFTRPLGDVTFDFVPYETEVAIYQGNRRLPMTWKENGDGEEQFEVATSTPRKYQVADLLPPDFESSQPIDVVRYSPSTGKIYFTQRDSMHQLRVLAGRNVWTHPGTVDLPEELSILDAAVSDQENVFLLTPEHGLLILGDEFRMQFGGMKVLPGFEQIEAPKGYYVRKSDEVFAFGADAWVTAGLDRNAKEGPAGAHEARSSTGIYRISPETRKVEFVEKPQSGVVGFTVGQHGLAYVTAFTVAHRPDPLRGEFETCPLPVAGGELVGFDSGGHVTILGRTEIALLDESGEWQIIGYTPAAHMSGGLVPGDDMWVCNRERIHQYIGGQLYAVPIEDSRTSDCAWANRGVVIGTASGRIVGIEPPRVHSIGLPEGILTAHKWKVDCSPQGVLLSGWAMEMQSWDTEKGAEALGPKTTIGFHVGDDTILAIYSLSSVLARNRREQPYYFASRISDGEWIQRQLPTDVRHLHMRDFAKLGNGKGLLATDQGLFELGFDSAELEEHQTPESPFAICALNLLPSGDIWLGNLNGKFCRLADSADPDQWKELKARGPAPLITRFAQATIDSKDVVLIGTTQGLYAYEPNSGEFIDFDTPFGATAFIQDIAVADATDSVIVSVRNLGMFVLKNDIWVDVDLGEEFDASMVWDVEVDKTGAYWLTTDEWFIKVTPEERKLFCFVDRVNTGSGWKALSAEPLSEVERDESLRIELSTSNSLGHAGFRYRTGSAPWQYLDADQSEIELAFDQEGSGQIEIQSMDHNHNFSQAVVLPVNVILPLWRWQSVRWGAASLVLVGLCLTAGSLRLSRRARQRQLQAEEAKALAEKERLAAAERSARERERLLLRVCHDLKNPLNVIFACTEMLENGELDANDATPLLNGSAESMNYLSKQLLSYSKSRRELPASNTLVSVNKVMGDLKRQGDLLRRRHGGEIAVRLSPDAPRILNTDAQAIKEVLGNLLDNATKHCPDGKIELSFQSSDHQPTFAVQDSGPGIPTEELESIFGAFYQSDVGNKRSDGLGLGLAICKTLAERLGGRLEVESELGKGARFTLVLPSSAIVSPMESDVRRTDGNESIPAPHFGGAFLQNGDSGPVLVIDDQEYVGTTIVQLLTKLNLQASYVGPNEAIANAGSSEAHRVLVDLSMPGKNGFEIARELRERYGESIQLIAMSESDQLVEVAEQVGFFDHVLAKSRLFEMLGRSKRSGTSSPTQETV